MKEDIGVRGTRWGLFLAHFVFAASFSSASFGDAWEIPFVPSAAKEEQQGFVRLKNLSDSPGEVSITAIDDAGRIRGPIQVALNAHQTRHFNSGDLEAGNVGKGLSGGVGAGTGDWRLALESELSFEALAYIRTSDGFVTSVFETAKLWGPDLYWVPFFNPGSNFRQVSKLRLVNTKNEVASVTIIGVDDRGQRARQDVTLTLGARSSRTITARQLEEGASGLTGRLGDGSGKWRLWVASDRRLHVLSLLSSPTGNLTNLSTGHWFQRHDAPLVLSSASPSQQGFVRVVNHSQKAGSVLVFATDDSGHKKGLVTLELQPFAVRGFNTGDLEQGNRDKGLSGGIGSGEGNWRLEFEPDEGLVITPLAYVRTSEGFVTSVHDLSVELSDPNTVYVPIFNPGSNYRQESELRVINVANESNRVEILGIDDSGSAAPSPAILTLPPKGVRSVTAKELEDGAPALSGRLGDGVGKWSLIVEAQRPVQVMSVLNSPTGNLTNLSATPFSFPLKITQAPIAHDVSLSSDLSSPYLETQLMATDEDDAAIGYVLDGEKDGQGYEDAYVEYETGRLFATLRPEGRDTVRIPYRATDGYEFSDRAYVIVRIEEASGDRYLGADEVTYAQYAQLQEAYFDPAIFSDFEDGSRSVPRSIDLSGNFPEPGSQGRQGSCVGWAVSYVKSYQERIEEGWDFRRATTFSPAWIYNQINRGVDEGSHPIDAMNLVVDRGAATLATMPYNDRDYLSQPSPEAIAEAEQFRALEVASVRSIDTWKAALAHRVPFVIGIPVYPSLQLLSGANAVYNDLSGVSQGGHAVVVVGFDDDKFGGSFKVLNSWGQGWGDDGFFHLPYDVLRHSKMQEYGWAFMLRDGANNVADRQPEPAPALNCGSLEDKLPNLVIDSWSASYNAAQGGSGSWQWSVVNRGNGAAAAGADMNLLLSSDSRIDASDHWVVYEEIPFDLEAGRGAHRDESNALQFQFPQSIPPGSYYMAAWIDDLDEVEECNEGDNQSLGRNQVVLTSDKPDLTIDHWWAEWDGTGQGTLMYQVSNQGTREATRTDWGITLLLHTDSRVAAGRRYDLFSEQGSHVLQPGGWVYRDEGNAAAINVTRSQSGTSIPAGVYYLSIWVDEFNVVDEASEINNFSTSNGFVTLGSASGAVPPRRGHGQFKSWQISGGDVEPGRRFNGHTQPPALMRQVEIVANPDGTRRVEFLDYVPKRAVVETGLASQSLPSPQQAQESADKVFAKRNVSADAVVAPVVDMIPMPK